MGTALELRKMWKEAAVEYLLGNIPVLAWKGWEKRWQSCQEYRPPSQEVLTTQNRVQWRQAVEFLFQKRFPSAI